jgi:glycosyltransferase involved in cell wall biosynthesis
VAELAHRPLFSRQLAADLDHIRPDVVHALRIPYEAILAAPLMRRRSEPFAVSIWGNDLTLFAENSPRFLRWTRRVLGGADGLHCDCIRDLNLARGSAFGFSPTRPWLLAPGSGGVDEAVFNTDGDRAAIRRSMNIAEGAPVVFNPRGTRDYVRNDTFLRAIPHLLASHPELVVLTVGTSTNGVLRALAVELGVAGHVRFLDSVPQHKMADLFRVADVSVSPSVHDGTPNSLIEAMACGSFPVAGDLPSIREWIEPGVNGLLVDVSSPLSIARGLASALNDHVLRSSARAFNLRLVDARASSGLVRQRIEAFYDAVMRRRSAAPTGMDLAPAAAHWPDEGWSALTGYDRRSDTELKSSRNHLEI